MTNLIKFLPSYVGSKSYWVDELYRFKNEHFVELFCGSSVLSANIAKSCVLNDSDPFIYKIFSNYNELIIPEIFTQDDYFKVRCNSDWWKYIYCLQKMSFSGVFRYSKNGYNVPVKKTVKSVALKTDYERARTRFKELNPVVYNLNYIDVPSKHFNGSVVILDPPYEKSQASYNKAFDYEVYWQYVSYLEGVAKKIVIFDSINNIPFSNFKTRKMRVNGKHGGDVECMFIFEDSLKSGHQGEICFHKYFKHLKRTDGFNYDFIDTITGATIELKSDYYDVNKTENFFIERYSDKDRKTNGGPWQSLEKNIDYYVYYFPKNNILFKFETNKLVERLNKIVNNLNMVNIPNKTWVTGGYKIKRELLSDICETMVLE